MRSLALLACLIFVPILQVKAQTLREDALKFVPNELSSISPKTSLSELQKKFEKKIIPDPDKKVLYLAYMGTKNDATIGTRDGKFHYLYFEIPIEQRMNTIGLYDKALQSLTADEKKKFYQKHQKDSSHNKGSLLTINLPKQAIRLEFVNNEKKVLRSIVVWSQGEVAP